MRFVRLPLSSEYDIAAAIYDEKGPVPTDRPLLKLSNP